VTKRCRNCSGLLDAYGVSLFLMDAQLAAHGGQLRIHQKIGNALQSI
jgi:hypothetical protein